MQYTTTRWTVGSLIKHLESLNMLDAPIILSLDTNKGHDAELELIQVEAFNTVQPGLIRFCGVNEKDAGFTVFIPYDTGTVVTQI